MRKSCEICKQPFQMDGLVTPEHDRMVLEDRPASGYGDGRPVLWVPADGEGAVIKEKCPGSGRRPMMEF